MQERTPIIDVHTHTFNATDVAAVDYLVDGFILGQQLGSHPAWLQGVLKHLLKRIIDGHMMGPREEALVNERSRLGEIGALADFRSIANTGAHEDERVILDPSDGIGRSDRSIDNPIHQLVSSLLNERGDFFQDGDSELKESCTLFFLYMMSYRVENTSALMRTFEQVELFAPAMIDFGASKVAVDLEEQMKIHEEIAKMSVKGDIPEAGTLQHVRVHPFFTFHPANERGLVMLKDAMGRGFLGAKIYPSMGWDPNPEAYDGAQKTQLLDFYRYCEEEEVPIKMHSGPTYFSDVRFRKANHPDQWREHVLAHFPKLRINFGHFGHGNHNQDDEFIWTKAVMELMTKFDHIYADIAFAKHADGFFREMDDFAEESGEIQRVHRRLMYGSDWFMITLQAGVKATLSSSRESYKAYLAQRYPEEQDALLTAYLGGNALGYLGLTEGGENRSRLLEWYQRNSLSDQIPYWLQS